MATKIEWTDETWNPLVGCSRISEGCDHCYAIGTVHRGLAPQHRGLTVHVEGEGTDWNGTVRLAEHRLDEPLRRTKPTRWFVNSLSDLFHPAVDDDTIARIFAVMHLAHRHTFQVLTKRPQRMARLLSSHEFHAMVGSEILALPDAGPAALAAAWTWPARNVWLGTSIELDKYSWRADHLRATPAAVRFISAEPLLGPLPSLDLTGIDWLIVGGESGPGARPVHPQWVRELRDRCQSSYRVVGHDHVGQVTEATHRPAFFFKQWGDWAPATYTEPDGRRPHRLIFTLPRNWPENERGVYVDRVGKKAAGRELDGRTWDEFPAEVA